MVINVMLIFLVRLPGFSNILLSPTISTKNALGYK